MFRAPNTKEEALWRTFILELDDLNRTNNVLQRRFWKLAKIVEYARSQYGEDIPYYWGRSDFLSYTYKSIVQLTSIAVKINNSYTFSQMSMAFMHNVAGYANDFDIIAPEGYLNEQAIKSAKFDKAELPGDPMEPGGELGIAFVPFVVYGVVVVVGLVTGAIAATAITNTLQKKYDTNLKQATLQAEKDILKDPKLFREWASYKKSTIKPIEGAIDKVLGEGVGGTLAKGAIALGAIAVVGLLFFRWIQRRK